MCIRDSLEIPLEGMVTDKHAELRVLVNGIEVADPKQEWITQEISLPDNATLTTGLGQQKPLVDVAHPRTNYRIRVVGDQIDHTLAEGTFAPPPAGWQQETWDVSEFSGKKVRFVFESRRMEDGVSFPLFGAPQIQARQPRGPQRNVILISLCLLYTSPSPRDKRQSRMPSSA